MITTDKVIEIFCIADDFCAEYENEIRNHQLQAGDITKRRNRKTQMSQSEIIAVMVCFHCGTFHNFKNYYLFYICKHMKSYFPNAVSYNRFVELQPRVIVPFMLLLKLFDLVNAQALHMWIALPLKYVITSVSTRIKYSGIWHKEGKVRWAGFFFFFFIWSVTKRVNC